MQSIKFPAFVAGVVQSLIISTCTLGAASRGPDFNGDGFPDLAIGVPDEGIGNMPRAGLFHVMYGSSGGLVADGAQTFAQDDPGIPGNAEPWAVFGASFGWGDFDGDGFDDLAVSALNQTINGALNAGSVTVLRGSDSGLTTAGIQYWNLNVDGLPSQAQQGDQFGAALSADDFNGDGFVDLAIGIPKKRVSGVVAGAVLVLYGSQDGLTNDNCRYVHQNQYNIKEVSEAGDLFGSALASGDFDGDGFADLAIGASGETHFGHVNAGGVNVLYGRSSGLHWSSNQFWRQRVDLMHNPAETGDMFGSSLAVGDLDGDGFDDLAVGAPGETLSGHANAGAVNVIYGSGAGLAYNGNQFWHAGKSGLNTAVADDEQFGFKIAAGDFDGDGRDDLAIGVPRRTVGTVDLAGMVQVIYGTGNGLGVARARTFDQDDANMNDHAEYGDRFGYAVAARDFNGDGLTDLAIGAPYESWGTTLEIGVLHILLSNSQGLTTVNNQYFTQDTPELNDPAEEADEFADYF